MAIFTSAQGLPERVALVNDLLFVFEESQAQFLSLVLGQSLKWDPNGFTSHPLRCTVHCIPVIRHNQNINHRERRHINQVEDHVRWKRILVVETIGIRITAPQT
jgi:hypothetical protein